MGEPWLFRERTWRFRQLILELEGLNVWAAAFDNGGLAAGFLLHVGEIEEERFDKAGAVGRGIIAVRRQHSHRLLIQLAIAEIEIGLVAPAAVRKIHRDAPAIGGATSD